MPHATRCYDIQCYTDQKTQTEHYFPTEQRNPNEGQ